MKKIIVTTLLSMFLISCQTGSREENVSENNDKLNISSLAKENSDTTDLFNKSVAILKFNYDQEPSENVALTARILSFDSNYTLLPVYKLNGVEYSDNGLFNDQVAGDGVYTSVERFSISENDIYNGVEALIGDGFLFKDQLIQQIKSDYASKVGPKASIKFGCKTKLIKCPNTSWYNTSYFGEPCVLFYDCELSVEIGIG